MNIEGNPVFLRAETTADDVVIPPFIEVIKDVTTLDHYTSKVMAHKDYKFKFAADADES